jgi:hypothetical protein
MASPTKKHKTRRTAKLLNQGQWRKNKLRREGSTAPNLPLTKPNANELAQAAKAKAQH